MREYNHMPKTAVTDEGISADAYWEVVRERDMYKKQRDALDERLAIFEKCINGNGYTLPEKAIAAIIMDAAAEHGPVRLWVGDRGHEGENQIRIDCAPDGVVRELLNHGLVDSVTVEYGCAIVRAIEEPED